MQALIREEHKQVLNEMNRELGVKPGDQQQQQAKQESSGW
jgi:hypothetical protein